MMDELREQLERLRYQVRMVGEALEGDAYPIQSLIIELDWGEKELDEAHDIFEKYTQLLKENEEFILESFEIEFLDRLSVGYQTLKLIILAFHKNNQWLKLCEAYVLAHDVMEFWEITDEIRERQQSSPGLRKRVRREIDDVKGRLKF